MTLVVRDEADVLDAQIAFHLALGVDLFLAVDHRSADRTPAILESRASAGRLLLFREPGEELEHAEWMTRLARLAAAEHGADWVICSDADEFWWPREGDLKGLLEAVPQRFGVVRGVWRHFVPRPGPEPFFAERMTVRTLPSAAGSPYRAQVKAVHRAHPAVEVGGGNHEVRAPGLAVLREWYPLEVLHFPVRSRAQCERKYANWRSSSGPGDGDPKRAIVRRALDGREPGTLYDELEVGEAAFAEGFAQGRLALDTRLRDVLRSLGSHEPGGLDLPRPRPADDAAFACEAALVSRLDALSRLRERLGAVERKAAAMGAPA